MEREKIKIGMATEEPVKGDRYNLRKLRSRLDDRGSYIHENRDVRARKKARRVLRKEDDPLFVSGYYISEEVEREKDPELESGYDFPPEGVDRDSKKFDKVYRKHMGWKLARLALCLFHKRREKGDTEYEIVSPVDYEIGKSKGLYYHTNFLAKPKGGGEDEVQLFFAVLVQYHPFFYEAVGCCPLGPPKPKSALPRGEGCRFCKYIRHSNCWKEIGKDWTPTRPPPTPPPNRFLT